LVYQTRVKLTLLTPHEKSKLGCNKQVVEKEPRRKNSSIILQTKNVLAAKVYKCMNDINANRSLVYDNNWKNLFNLTLRFHIDKFYK
jgi:hypothetical protein